MSGEAFFSTLAQVTAAIASLIIAIAMVIYSLEKERKMRHIADFRDRLEEFYFTYEKQFDAIQANISRNNVNKVNEYIFNEHSEKEIRNDMFSDDFQNHPVTVQFYCLAMHIAIKHFQDLRPGKPRIPDIETIRSIGQALWEIDELLNDEENYREIYLLFVDSSNVPEDFMDKHIINNPEWESEIEINTLSDVKKLSSDMLNDYLSIRDRLPAVYSDYTADFYDILNISIYLIIMGVVFPLLIMFTPPESFQYEYSDNLIFIYQTLLIIGSGVLTLSLIDLIRVTIKSNINESYEQKWFTQGILHYLPSII